MFHMIRYGEKATKYTTIYTVSWQNFHRKTGRGKLADKSLCTICFKVKGLMRAQSEEEIGSVPGR